MGRNDPQRPTRRSLPPANHAALADAWLLGPGRRSVETILPHLHAHLVGGDTLEKDAAIALVEKVLTALQRHAAKPFTGPLVPLPDARLETLYFDGQGELDWPTFAFADEETYAVLDARSPARGAVPLTSLLLPHHDS